MIPARALLKHEDTMDKLYAKFRSLPGYQQDAAFFLAGVVAAGIVAALL